MNSQYSSVSRHRASVASALMLVATAGASVLAQAGPPNVVLIVSDDQGYGDVSCFGGDIPTPNIDAIAERGARLTSFYVAAPVCTPSRFSLLTGRYPQRSQGGLHSVGMMFNEAHRSHGLRSGETTVAACLQAAGYRTALFGKWHLGHGAVEHYPTRHGFDEFYGALGGCIDYFDHAYAFVPDWYRDEQPLVEDGYSTTLLTREAVGFVERQSAETPFFLCLTYFAPHYGKSLAAEAALHDHTLSTAKAGGERINPHTGETCQPINSLQAPLEDLRQVRHVEDPKRRYYSAMVRALDDGVGEVMAALAAADLDENTIVLFLADNGPDMTVSNAGDHGSLRGAKHSLWEGGIRVPATVQWPAQLPAGSVIDAPLSALDVLPTLCSLSGAALPDGPLDGMDASAVLFAGEALERTLYWRQGKQEALRRGRWKLVFDDLYDVVADPGERHDLATQHPDLVAELIDVRQAMRDSLTPASEE